jgi:glycerate 2-kinase
MRILIAPDSFKESLTATEVAHAIASGLKDELADAVFDLVPIADGGEGTVDAIVGALSGVIVTCEVTGPLGENRQAAYGLVNNGVTAIIEMAEASGLALVPESTRDPSKTTTFGCGELVANALGRGVKEIVFGVGGSATNDGGLGMCQALGARFFDHGGTEIVEPICGGKLEKIHSVDINELRKTIASVTFTAACDVNNPLLGCNGATYIFGPQKGGSPDDLERLESGLANAYGVIEEHLGKVIRDVPGAGAAGGMGAALMALLNANLRPGVELIAELTQLPARIAKADLVITGEGCLDGQSALGKAPVGIAKIAAAANVPVIAIGGMVAENAPVLYEHGINVIESTIVRPCSTEEAIANAHENLVSAARRIGRWIKFADSIRLAK